MINYPDIHPSDEAGVFVLLELGVFFKQDRLALGVFSGLRLHVGGPPTSPNPFPASLRLAFICYPPSGQLDGTARLGLAALPDRSLDTLAPEHINPECVYLNSILYYLLIYLLDLLRLR